MSDVTPLELRKMVAGYDDDRLYLDLLGARERLCRAQGYVPVWWMDDLQQALDAIDRVGSSVVPKVWSASNQPELPESA